MLLVPRGAMRRVSTRPPHYAMKGMRVVLIMSCVRGAGSGRMCAGVHCLI